MDKVYKYIIQKTVTDKIDKKDAVHLLELLKQEKDKRRQVDIAVIGMAAKTSRADNVRAFWDNLEKGTDGIRRIPTGRQRDLDEYLRFKGAGEEMKKYRELGYLDEIDKFDYEYFNLAPREAELMDPNQRLFLEAAYTAIEDAGYNHASLKGTKTGLYLGFITANFTYQNLLYEVDAAVGASTILANMAALIPSRVSYLLDLRGPSILVDTTCSSSLVAVHLACQSIRNGECEQALVGGVKINLMPLLNGPKIGIESSGSRTLAFDEASDGTGQGEGVGVVMLKPLKQALRDGDNIQAVIKGSAINQDGRSMGITAPNTEAQTEVVCAAWEAARVEAETISYIEAHGTGTKLGDPIEIEGLSNAFRRYTDKKQFCAVASVKSNIGHLDEAAGIFGLIKTVLSLQKKQLPASLNFHEPNHKIDWAETPLFVNDRLCEWEALPKKPRRAGVSSFGLSGTNCHVVVEEYEEGLTNFKNETGYSGKIFTLSAKSREQLSFLVLKYLEFLSSENKIDLENVCYTLNSGRSVYSHRLAFVFENFEELLEKLKYSIELLENNQKNKEIYYRVDKVSEKNKIILNSDFIDWRQDKDVVFLKQVAKEYVLGREINWSEFYRDEKKQKVSLPTYPFEKKRCWFKLPATATEEPLFELGWREQEVEIEPIEVNEILVFNGMSKKAEQICEALAREVGRENLTEVVPGKKFKKLSKNKYSIGNSLADYQALLSELKDRKLYQIVHLFSLEDKIRSVMGLAGLENSQEQGVMSFFYLAKALRLECADKVLNLVLVSQLASEVTGDEKIIKPENSPLFGLGRALVVEFPNWRCRAIDIDEKIKLPNLVKEIRSEYKNHKVAFRDNVRYIEEFRHHEPVETNALKLRTGGVYLFTGGTSGIVLELIKYLSQREKIKIVLLNRSGFSPQSEWKNILAAKNTPENLRLSVEAYAEVIKNGSVLYFYQADISVATELELVLAKIKKEVGAINGVVHAAGIAKEKEFDLKTEEEFRYVLSIKIQGTWLLDRLTRDQSLDFFSLFSSAITCFSGAHNGDYIAANSYLDSYAFWGRRQGVNFSSVNWPFWDKVGMHVRQVINRERVPLKNISAEQGTELWFESLNRARPGLVVVGKLNHEGRSAYLIKNSPFTFSPKIISQIEENIDVFSRTHEIDQVDLRGGEKSDYSLLEKDIAQILYDVLGYKEIDIDDNFFDLGGDSLFLAEIFYRLEKKYPGMLNITQLFAYPTVSKLAEYLSRTSGTTSEIKSELLPISKSRDIAVIGIAAKTSLADNVDELWQNLSKGRECIRPIPKERKIDIDNYLRAVGAEEKYLFYSPLAYLSHVDQFDYEYFKFSPREAKLMDPNHRLFLETVITAIEEAGYGGEKMRGSNTGLYLGYGPSDFDYKSFISNSKFATSTALFTGNLNALIPSRVSYLLDLRGPSLVVDTACSSSLVAIHLACQALLSGDCEVAVAGGVRLNLVPLMNRFKVGIESSDWYTRTFDDASDGTGMGEGAAAVILKPLDKAIADGDNIHAVIKGSAINQDGQSVGITAPNTRAQTEVIASAWMNAQIDPANISYIEAHGTGTSLGDPIEIEGITNAFRAFTDKKQFCAISAIKPNLGHTLEAAGIFSFIKAVLSLQNKKILPSINFHEPNHRVDWETSAVYVNDKIQSWEKTAKPRLCGVSSFGLSGTNCHVVLSEDPTVLKVENKNSGLNIFTISAKNRQSFKALVDLYLNFISEHPSLVLPDLCYTANTGRGHYEERMAIMADSLPALLKKLILFKKNSYQTKTEEGIFYNYHQVISGHKKTESVHEISAVEIRRLSTEVAPFLKKISQQGNFSENFSKKICQAYVAGAKVNWGKAYEKFSCQKLSLPTYPFLGNRCWADLDDQIQSGVQTGNLQYLHPLLEKCLVKSSGQDIYATNYSAKKHFVLSDHIINGSHVLPGTVYLEIAKQVGRLYYGELPLEIKNLSFITPVITDKDEQKEVQIVVEENGGFKKFFALSQRLTGDGQGQWLRHVEGEIHPRTDLVVKTIDLTEIKNRCQQKKMAIDINKNAAGFIDFGLRWQNYHFISFGKDEALAELELPLECVHDLETYFLHPPMLDMAVAAVSMATGFKALPFAYGSFRIIAPMTRKIYSHFKRIGAYDEVEETISFDLEILDQQGRVLAEIDNFKLKRTRDFRRVIQRNKNSQTSKYYRAVWEASPRLAQAEKSFETTLVFKGQSSRAQAIFELLKKDHELIAVEFGGTYKKINDNEYIVKNQLEDYTRLIKELKVRSINRIVHLSSLAEKAVLPKFEKLEESQQSGIFSLFYLIKALTINIVKEKVDIVLVSEYAELVNDAQKEIRPENASLVGFGKAPILEDSNWQCRSIDIDEVTSAEFIVAEINSEYLTYKSALRNNLRYIEILKHYNPELAEKSDVKIKAGGNYLITGGAGGVGLEVATRLAKINKINLILLNRTKVPERDTWPEVLASQNPVDRKFKKIINKIEEIEELGSRVSVFRADIADRVDALNVWKKIKQEYNHIDGIIHSAGVPGDGFIAYKDEATIKKVFAPKLQGTIILDEISQKEKLDFFVLFSSSTSFHSAPGQSDYTAANSFLDAYGEYRNRQGRNTLVVNWAGWKEVGMLSTSRTLVNYGTLTTEDALDSLLIVLGRKINIVMIGALTYVEGVLFSQERFPLELSTEVKAEIFYNNLNREKIQERTSILEIKLKGGSGEYKELEKVLAQIWSEVLGIAEIDINDHFFDLGGDSLRIAEVHSLLEKKYPGKFSVAELFAYPTIVKLVQHIEGQNFPVQAERQTKDLLAEQDIAIIGMAAQTSQARDVEEFWQNLADGIDCIREAPASRRQDMDNYLRFKGVDEKLRRYQVAAYLEEIDKFDYEFFRISPREASLMDPNQRVLLETIYHGLENAGYGGTRLFGSKTGLYVGLFPLGSKYYDLIAEVEPLALSEAMVNNMDPTIASRVSYYLNLTGPSMLVNTACSSSLVAVHLACQAIRNGDCDQAIVGSVKISLLSLLNNPKVGIESADGHTRTFDNNSDGTGLGEGVAAIVLKPLKTALKDGDNILAVLKGSAINQDGQSVGMTAPNALSQTEVVLSAWQTARIDPETVSFIEAHGTGTNLGDPIEIEALAGAFRKFTNRKQFCAISSVKSNLGHLLEAAGIFGLIKSVLAMNKKMLPPSINVREPNEKVNWEETPIYINNRLRSWEKDGEEPRRAGVSSFGLSGTNCHVVLEEAPQWEKVSEADLIGRHIFVLSARNRVILKVLIKLYLDFFQKNSSLDLESLCYTVSTGRAHLNARLVAVVSTLSELVEKLEKYFTSDGIGLSIDGLYFGEFKIVPFGQKLKQDGEITEKEALNKAGEMEIIAQELFFSQKEDGQLVQSFCESYVAGASFDWLKLYKNKRYQKIALPLYPFARERCWLDVPGAEKFNGFFQATKWIRSDLEKVGREIKGLSLVFINDSKQTKKIISDLEKHKGEIIKVKIGSEFSKINRNFFQIRQTKEDYNRLLSELSKRKINRIIHLLSLSDKTELETLEELNDSQNRGAQSLLFLTQSLQTNVLGQNLDLFLITEMADLVNGNETEIKPENAVLIGFGKSVSMENPNLRCRVIDLDQKTKVEAVIKELNSVLNEYKVAYRDNTRYIEEFGEIDINDFKNLSLVGHSEQTVQVRPGGVYLITGGTGGIGMEVAKRLASIAKIKIVLLGRQALPASSEWENILNADGPKDRRLLRQIENLQTIEKTGSEFLFVQADIADWKQMTKALDLAKKKFGEINGIIHAAGIAGDGFVANKGEAELRRVLAPKVQGTWILDQITRGDNLDFFILFSSAVTLVSGLGVSDYVAANSYLDAYAFYLSLKNRRALTINWATWENLGLSFGENVNEKKQLLKVITPETAISILLELLMKDLTRVAVGQVNYESDVMYLGDYLPLNFSQEIKNRTKQKVDLAKKQIRTVKLKGGLNDEYSSAEKDLAAIWSEVLGYEEIDVRDNFFELGGDSLSGIRLISRINQRMSRSLSFREVLQNPSLKSLAIYLAQAESVEYKPVIKKVKPKKYKLK